MTRAIRKHLGDFIALVVLFVIALGVTAYIVANQDARPRIPLIESKAFILKAVFSTGQAVTPGQGQSVRIAGVQVGKITGVDLKNGAAVVTMELDKKWPKKIPLHPDASALLRPRTGLKDMFVELDPGTTGPALKSGAEIPVANTAPDINPDEVLSALDTDTRSYLQLLINGAGKGLAGHGNDLNATFKALSPTYRDLNRVSSAVAQRRTDLMQLIHEFGDLSNHLADKDREIRTLVSASDAVFQAFASQQQNLSLAVSRLPAALRQTQGTLTKVIPFANTLRPTLESLRPAFRQLNTTNHQIIPFAREAFPILKNKIRPFVQVGRPYFRNLRPAATNLAAATPDFTATFHELNRFFDIAAFNPRGNKPQTSRSDVMSNLFWVGWVGELTNSLFNTSDAIGSFRRAYFGLDCATIRSQLAENPASGPLIGLSNALNDPGLCPSIGSSGNGGGLLPGLPVLKGTGAKTKTGGGKAAPTTGNAAPTTGKPKAGGK